MKKHRISKYRLIAIALLIMMFILYMKNVSSGLKAKAEIYIPLVLYCASGLFFIYGPGVERREEENRRKDSIKNEYPEFALKMSMLIRAGFSPKAALTKVGNAYSRRKKAEKGKKVIFYEEILTALREMESGIPETEAYERLGKRCGLMEMIRFCGLMIRNVKRGSMGLADELKEESRRAIQSKREMERKKGEVAGTKLLFPMMLFLLIVMIIILYPGFTTIAAM